MLFKRLELKNFRMVKDFSYEFGNPEFLLIDGRNGQGKSTVNQAIQMALFNDYIGSFDDYINWDHDKASIDFEFEHNGTSYNVSMALTRGKGSERVLTDRSTGKTYKNKNAVDQLVSFGVTSQMKAAMIMKEQEVTVVDTSPAQRRDLLQSTYQEIFDPINASIEEAKNEVKEHKDNVDKLSDKKQEIESREYEEKSFERLPFSESEYSRIKDEVGSLEDAKDSLLKEESRIEEKKAQKKELEREIDYKRRQLLKSKDDLAKDEAEYEKKNSELSSIDVEKEISEYVKELYESVESLEGELAGIEDLEEKSLDNSFDEQELSKCTESRINAESRLDAIDHKIGLIDQGACPECGRPWEDHDKEKIQSEREAIAKELAELQEKERQLKKERDRIAEENKDIERHNRRVSENRQRIEHLKKQIEDKKESNRRLIDERRKSIESKIESIKESAKSLGNSISAFKQFIENAEKEVADKEASLNEYDDSEIEGRIQDINEKIRSTRESIKELNDKLQDFDDTVRRNREIEQWNKSIEEKRQRDEKEIEDIQFQIESVEKKREIAKEAITTLQKLSVFSLQEIMSTLQNYAQEFIDKVYDGRHSLYFEEKNDKLMLLYGPRKQDVKTASGYERKVFSLAYKYAFGKGFGIESIILDEPDSQADTEYSKNLFYLLAELIEEGVYSQIMLVTHKDDLKQMLKSEHDISTVTFNQGEAI